MSEVATTKPKHEIVIFKDQLDQRAGEFKAALPAHIPVERFTRVVLTAVQTNPDLLKLNRRSLFTSAVKCATDGLLPDGREAALVPYKDEVQYLPMIAGVRKKVRNSGEIATWDVQAVYENDDFDFELGDSPFISHRPTLGDRGRLIAVYSIATLKGGEKSRDVMSVGEVEKIRALSRGKNTPWTNPTFYAEMAKKTVAKRHSKVLPMSTDLDDLMRRDDALYDLDSNSDKALAAAPAPKSLGSRLDRLAAPEPEPEDDGTVIDNETGEIIEAGGAAEGEAGAEAEGGEPEPEKKPEPEAKKAEPEKLNAIEIAQARGHEARLKGMSRKAVPPEYRADDRKQEAGAWLTGHDAADREIKAKEGAK
jgi:recombination protein RecT